jgi:hypothetical protein
VLRILTDNPNSSLSFDNLAVWAYLLYCCTYFHNLFLTYICIRFCLSSYHMAKAPR